MEEPGEIIPRFYGKIFSGTHGKFSKNMLKEIAIEFKEHNFGKKILEAL